MCYSEMLTSSTNESKMSWNIIDTEVYTASKKRFTQTKFKLGNKCINYVDEFITQQPKIELAVFSLRELFPCEFLKITNIPVG